MTGMRRVLCALLLAASAAACGDEQATTSPSTTTGTTATEVFTGTIAPRGSAFYAFTVTSAGNVSITLASVAYSRVGPAVTARLTVGVGTPSGFGCAVTSAVDTSTGLTAQLTATGAADNIYCVNVTDPGALTGDATFVIRILHT
ncbi:MAG: hypothetical protein AB7H96_03255 [Vicinamibacterales bacterium]